MLETQRSLTYLCFCKKARYPEAKPLKINRPRQIVTSTPLNGLNRRICRVVIRNQDHVYRRIGANHTLQQVHPYPIWHVQIKHHVSRLSLQKELEAGLWITCCHYLQSLRRECLQNQRPVSWIIFDHQQFKRVELIHLLRPELQASPT
jgi:hypothetical protein